MTVRNDGRSTGILPVEATSAARGPEPTTPLAPTDPPGSGGTVPSAPQDHAAQAPATGSAAASIDLLGGTPDRDVRAAGQGKPPSAMAPIDPAAGPHDPFRPGPGVTQDRYDIGMRRGFYHLGFERTRSGGDFRLGVMGNATGGGAHLGGMIRTPLGPNLSLAWGGNLEATVQKAGTTTLVQVNPDLLGQLRYNDRRNQFALNAGLYNRVAVGWDHGAAKQNVNTAKGLGDQIAQEFEALKAKAGERVGQLTTAANTLIAAVKATVPEARDRFLQLAQERLSAQLGDAAQALMPILAMEVGAAFGAYMQNISTIAGDMADAVSRAAAARTPGDLQKALTDLADGISRLQAATGSGSLDPYMQSLQQRLVDSLGAEGAAQAGAIGAILGATASEVGNSLVLQVNSSLQAFLGEANGILTDLFGDATAALDNAANAVGAARDNYQSMTTIAMQSRLGVGVEYGRYIDFLSSPKHDFATTLTVGGNYYHPVMETAWTDGGTPKPLVLNAATGPQADWHAGVGVQKWWGSISLGANVGYRGTYNGGGVQHAPEFGISFSSRFAN